MGIFYVLPVVQLVYSEQKVSYTFYHRPACVLNLEYHNNMYIIGKFGDLAVCLSTSKLKFAKIFFCVYADSIHVPYHQTLIHQYNCFNKSFGATPPDLMNANISGYMVGQADRIFELLFHNCRFSTWVATKMLVTTTSSAPIQLDPLLPSTICGAISVISFWDFSLYSL